MTLYDRATFWLLTSGASAPRPLRVLGHLGAHAASLTARMRSVPPTVPASFAELLHAAPARSVGRPPKVMLCIGSLSPGGAERQYCNLAVALSRRGYPLSLVTTAGIDGTLGHYAGLLRGSGLDVRVAGVTNPLRLDRRCLSGPVRDLPAYLAPPVLSLLAEIWVDPPDIVHAWLDHTNVWAGVAGLLAGVPLVVLSTRNVNPSHFPYLHQPWFRPWYDLLARSSRVHFINNSRAGAVDYAEWLGLPRSRFSVVLNGLDPGTVRTAGPEEVAALRRSLGLSEGQPLVGGVFRLSDEKQPEVFVEVVKAVLSARPAAHAALVGAGPREVRVREAIEAAGLSARFHLLGNIQQTAAFFSACSLLLHTSRHEGTPNALLEAQHLRCPPVATAAAGTLDAVLDGVTGFLLPVGDVGGLSARVQQLLDEPDTRLRLAEAGPPFIAERFGLDRMVDETVAVYERGLERLEAATRPAPSISGPARAQ